MISINSCDFVDSFVHERTLILHEMISINSCGFVEVNGYLGVDKKSP